MVQAVRADLGDLFKVSAESVHFVGSTTEGMKLLALSVRLNPGDAVLVADDELPSVTWPWKRLEEVHGIRVTQVRIPDERKRSAVLAASLTVETKVLVVSHVHWRTGTQVNLARLSKACSERQCRLIVNGEDAVGAVPVDSSKVDAYCASVFKWLLSGLGLGFALVDESLAADLVPEFPDYSNEPPSRSLAYSHINHQSLYALHATLTWLRMIGWELIYARQAHLSGYVAHELQQRGLEVLTPERGRAGIISFHHPRATRLVATLAEQSILVEDLGNDVVRLSTHFYNTDEDIDRLMSALDRLL